VYVHPEAFPNSHANFNVIKIKLSEGQIKKLLQGVHKPGGPLVTDATTCLVVNSKIDYVIGSPISYEDFLRNERRNPKGNRRIAGGRKDAVEEDSEEDDLLNEVQKLKQHPKESNGNSTKTTNQQLNPPPNQPHNSKPIIQNPPTHNQSLPPPKPAQSRLQSDPKPPPSKPIVKLDEPSIQP
jgi:hypothetical protein